MNLELLARVNELQSQLGFSDANMGANARNWIEEDDELLGRWIAHLERVLSVHSLLSRTNMRRKPSEVWPVFFVLDVRETDPEVHRLDIFLGERQPDVPERAELQVFLNKQRLRDYLMAGEWDMATIYKSPKRPQEEVDELTAWMSLHMDLRQVKIHEE